MSQDVNEQCVIPAATLCWGLGGATLFLDGGVRLEFSVSVVHSASCVRARAVLARDGATMKW